MEKIISDILQKISRYEIITNLIPGTTLCIILRVLGYNLLIYGVFVDIVICYLVGVINGRVGSLLIEGFLKWIKILKWREYSLYNKAKAKRPFIATLQETANMYRAFTAVFLNLLIVILFTYIASIWEWFDNNKHWIAVLLLFILFVISYCKQVNEYVIKNIDEANGED